MYIYNGLATSDYSPNDRQGTRKSWWFESTPGLKEKKREMKKIILTSLFFALTGIIFSQVSFDSTGYKAFQKISYSPSEATSDSSNVLFWFETDKVIITTNDQTKNLYFVDQPFEDILKTGHHVKRVQCKDDGGFLCALSTGHILPEDVDFISIEYNNIIFFYKVHETSERFWDSNPDELIPFEINTDPYTPEEYDKLVESYQRLKNSIKIF